MNCEDIIRMAREACPYTSDELRGAFFDGYIKGAAAEREKVAQWMIKRSYTTGHGDTTEDLLAELDWQITERIAKYVDDEREECAKIAWERFGTGGREIAGAIRARGEQ